MPMPPYRVCCTRRSCDRVAVYKIASRWSDGITRELKTYALSCRDCLPGHLSAARTKQLICRLAPGESLDPPGIYEIATGSRDAQLIRRDDLLEELNPFPPLSE